VVDNERRQDSSATMHEEASKWQGFENRSAEPKNKGMSKNLLGHMV
jgi:hypothetical protein